MMRWNEVKYVGIGVLLALVSVVLAWVFVPGSWRTLSLYLLGAQFIFLLLLPGKKDDRRFGPHTGPAASVLGASTGKIQERHLLQWSGQLIAVPLILAAIVIALTL